MMNSFKPCRFLLTTRNKRPAYCLKYREWGASCPDKCGYFVKGEPGDISKVQQEYYNFECLSFNRTEQNRYYCTLYQQEKPLCKACVSATFKTVKISDEEGIQ